MQRVSRFSSDVVKCGYWCYAGRVCEFSFMRSPFEPEGLISKEPSRCVGTLWGESSFDEESCLIKCCLCVTDEDVLQCHLALDAPKKKSLRFLFLDTNGIQETLPQSPAIHKRGNKTGGTIPLLRCWLSRCRGTCIHTHSRAGMHSLLRKHTPGLSAVSRG